MRRRCPERRRRPDPADGIDIIDAVDDGPAPAVEPAGAGLVAWTHDDLIEVDGGPGCDEPDHLGYCLAGSAA